MSLPLTRGSLATGELRQIPIEFLVGWITDSFKSIVQAKGFDVAAYRLMQVGNCLLFRLTLTKGGNVGNASSEAALFLIMDQFDGQWHG